MKIPTRNPYLMGKYDFLDLQILRKSQKTAILTVISNLYSLYGEKIKISKFSIFCTF